ncbi:MAG: glycosyltransferase family 4 protein [Patescibacteria group bacterium]|jgi:glycosyltransferase involved in cell wall biosynthesis
MKLLILTQTVDNKDDVLGFMHGWIAGFAKKCERVTVVCLKSGKYCLPDNVRVLSLGKERRKSRIAYLFNFYKHIWQNRQDYDKVFVHMNYEYIILGAVYWRILRKKVALWYAHGYVPIGLRIAEKLTHVIFTSTKSGCRIDSIKIKVVGQGIDVDGIKNDKLRIKNNRFKIITIGRISPSKDYETLIRAAEALVRQNAKVKVDIIGGPGTPGQKEYLGKLREMVKEKKLEDAINFRGSLPNREIAPALNEADLFVNMGLTGSLDKAILEAMAAGLPILTCNEALEDVIGNYSGRLMYKKKDYMELSEKIKYIMGLSSEERAKIGNDLREIVAKDHSLSDFIDKILAGL